MLSLSSLFPSPLSLSLSCPPLHSNLSSLPQKLGVLDLMDEESRFPKGTDKSLLEKMHGNHKVYTCTLLAIYWQRKETPDPIYMYTYSWPRILNVAGLGPTWGSSFFFENDCLGWVALCCVVLLWESHGVNIPCIYTYVYIRIDLSTVRVLPSLSTGQPVLCEAQSEQC